MIQDLLLIILLGLTGFIVGLNFSNLIDYIHDKIMSTKQD